MRSADRYYCVEGLTDFFASCHGLVRFSRSMGAVSQFFGGEIARGKHLFPFRTEPLSLSAPMVLGGQPPGRVGRRRSYLRAARKGGSYFALGRPSRRVRYFLAVILHVTELPPDWALPLKGELP